MVITAGISSEDVLIANRPIVTGRGRRFRKVNTRPLESFPQYICPNPGIISESRTAIQICLLFLVFGIASVISNLL
jgi:hypothetical protein